MGDRPYHRVRSPKSIAFESPLPSHWVPYHGEQVYWNGRYSVATVEMNLGHGVVKLKFTSHDGKRAYYVQDLLTNIRPMKRGSKR